MNSLFPQELINTIIDYHFHDQPTLAACGLVCKAWLPASRYHLFHTLKLVDENWDTFLDLIQIYHARVPSTIVPNANNQSHLLHAVRVLNADGSQFTGSSFSQLAHLISSFPHLHSFTWTPGHPRSRSRTSEIDPVELKFPPHFHTIDIAGNCDEIRGFLDRLNGMQNTPRLSTIKIYYACARNVNSIRDLLRIQGRSLRHLELSWSYYGC